MIMASIWCNNFCGVREGVGVSEGLWFEEGLKRRFGNGENTSF